MTKDEKVQLEEIRMQLMLQERVLEKILLFLEDDKSSSTKGLITRINDLEQRQEKMYAFMGQAKWIIGAIAVPISIYLVKKFIDVWLSIQYIFIR